MALNWTNVKRGWEIINAVNPKACNSFIKDCSDDIKEVNVDVICGYSPRPNDGWENVYTDIQDMTDDQRKLFLSRVKEVGNTSFLKEIGNGVTRIGWI